jgi:hypothetical protein
MGTKLFNHLPVELKQLDNFKQFRKKVKSFLLNKPLYSLKEFFCVGAVYNLSGIDKI